MIPGPTIVEPSVLRAMSQPTLSHTSVEFAQMLKECLEGLKKIMNTTGDVFAISGSGTLGMEMGVANIIEHGDKVLVISTGYFGDRFADVVSRYTPNVEKLAVEWGKAPSAQTLAEKLSKEKFKATLVTHVDTSTGVVNNLKELSRVVKNSGSLFVVDTVCSLGGIEVRVDDWDIDVCLSGSQKAMAVPPGIAILSASEEAQKVYKQRKSQVTSYYMDFGNWLPIMHDTAKYFATPPVNMIYALHESLRLIFAEGLEKRYSRHKTLAESFRAGCNKIGLRPVAEKGMEASTMTALHYPTGIKDEDFRTMMANKQNVQIAGGLGPLRGKAFRVGHMGCMNSNDVTVLMGAIERSLLALGYGASPGAGVAALTDALVKGGF